MMFDAADLLVWLIPAIPAATLLWFVICLVRKLTYRGEDVTVRKSRNFWLILSGIVFAVIGGSFLAMIILFAMAIAHM
ncbi:MAG: hypothetical protein IJC75_05510 [Oscillospiraceae bacterium]|nr:hypothetical protein [Ruminococcus sp.]MBQ4346577.1 hypothetical protein [Oscillospiraceae bacterium]